MQEASPQKSESFKLPKNESDEKKPSLFGSNKAPEPLHNATAEVKPSASLFNSNFSPAPPSAISGGLFGAPKAGTSLFGNQS